LRGADHIGEKGIHTAGWNSHWETWFAKHEKDGVKVTEEMVLKQLAKMKNMKQFKSILALGKQATRNFGVKAIAKVAAKTAKAVMSVGKVAKMGLKKGGKAIPGVGILVSLAFWPGDMYAKGIVNGTVNSAIDAIPFVGLGKAVTEFALGDFIPDLENYDPELYDADPELADPDPDLIEIG
jgi:hypothetical protein